MARPENLVCCHSSGRTLKEVFLRQVNEHLTQHAESLDMVNSVDTALETAVGTAVDNRYHAAVRTVETWGAAEALDTFLQDVAVIADAVDTVEAMVVPRLVPWSTASHLLEVLKAAQAQCLL